MRRIHRLARFETLETRCMLAIDWVNAVGANAFNSNGVFNSQEEAVAREIINRAIDDWEAVIQSFNYADNTLNDTYTLNINAGLIAGRGVTQNFQFSPLDNLPFSADITLDDNGTVQQADWNVWINHWGNTLTRVGV